MRIRTSRRSVANGDNWRSAFRPAFNVGLLCVAWTGCLSSPLFAQDKVVLRKPGSIGRTVVNGLIIEFNGKRLDLKPHGGGPVQHFSAEEVIDVETTRVTEHARGLLLWAEGDLDGAVQQLELALKQEPRAWSRREILAALVRCAVRRSNPISAGNRFLAIYKSDPETRHLRVIPLIWAAGPIDGDSRSAAQGWMTGTNEAARLMGASILYHDRDQSRAAQSTLRDLAKNGPDRIRELAQWQLRRNGAFSDKVTRGELAYWERALNDLPADLQGGPCYLLGEAWSRLHEFELAAAYWTRLTVLCDYDYPLAARATHEAARALERIGQSVESETLYEETISRFADTASARESQEQLAKSAGRRKPPQPASPSRPK